jgi:glycosyltransferase involved in cell wall biosynthesis
MEGRLQNLYTWLKDCTPQVQIILVSDSSSDNTSNELQGLRESLPLLNIVIIEGVYGSPGSARNAGLERVENEWTVFWDSDDIGDPKKLLEELSKMNEDNCDSIIFGYEVYSKDSQKGAWSLWPETKEKRIEVLSLNPGIWRFCFRSSRVKNLKFSHLRMAEDQLFIDNFLQKFPHISFSNIIVYKYFINISTQLTRNKDALEDLQLAGRLLSRKLATDSQASIFTIRIYGKILVTQMKKCRFSTKFRAGIMLTSLCLKHPKAVSSLLLGSLLENSN